MSHHDGRRSVPASGRRMRSPSLTTPSRAPDPSTTGAALMWRSSRSLATSVTDASGPTVTTGLVITSLACMVHFLQEVQAGRPAAASARMRSLAFSAIITTGALVLPETSVGMIEQSTTRRPATPCTRSRSSTTAIASLPILQVPDGWKIVAP